MESKIKFWVIGLVVIWGLGLGFASCRAQTAAEFFRQKKTQEKYLLKQLAYLELYGAELRKGYALAKEGWGTIKGFTSGEFKLHEAFFDALAKVSGVVRNDFRVGEIAAMQLQVRASFRQLAECPALTPAHKDYLEEVRKKVVEECGADLSELLDIVLSPSVEMNDAERLARLKVVHEAMAVKAEFVAYFCAQVQGMIASRKLYRIDLEFIRSNHEKN